MPKAQTWTPEKITAWVSEFYERAGQLPGVRDMDHFGPNRSNRRVYGGVAGVLAVAGFSAAAYGIRRLHTKHDLIEEVRNWAEEHHSGLGVISQEDLLQARASKQLTFHPDTIGNHFDSWREFLVESGLAQYQWSPRECVQFARTLVNRYEHGKLAKLTGKFAIEGKTPVYSDFLAHYDDIKQFMFARVHWENWQPKKERKGLQEAWIGYAALALARTGANTRLITAEMNTMRSQKLGPGYDVDLIAEVFPAGSPTASGVHLIDRAVVEFEHIGSGSEINIHPVFKPEFEEVGIDL